MLPGGSEVAKKMHLHATSRELPAERMKGVHRKEKIAGGYTEIGRRCSFLIKCEFCCCHGNRTGKSAGNIYQWVKYSNTLAIQEQDFSSGALMGLQGGQIGEFDPSSLTEFICPPQFLSVGHGCQIFEFTGFGV